MGLPALPPAVTAMSRLEYLECSMNLPSITLPPGTYLASLTLLAADWETLAGSTAALSSLHKREWGGVGWHAAVARCVVCIMERPLATINSNKSAMPPLLMQWRSCAWRCCRGGLGPPRLLLVCCARSPCCLASQVGLACWCL